MTDLDRASLDRILPSAPGLADWDDVISRSRAGHGRRRRRLVVLTMAALVVVGATSAFAMHAFFIDKGFIGVPPVGATPSAPESGVLEMSYWVPSQGNPRRSQNWVYADGRLIRLLEGDPRARRLRVGANRWSSGFLEQRLTPEGVELLRSEIVSTGLFGHDRDLRALEHPCLNFIHVRNGDRLVRVTWHGTFCPQKGKPVATPQQANALERLVARLANPASWLPASAWKQRKIRAYVPSRFEVCAWVPGGPLEPSRIVALLPEAAQNALRARDWNTRGVLGSCFDVTTKGARALAKALDGAGPAKKGGAFHLNYTFETAPGASRKEVAIIFEPYLPHGETTCSACG